MKKDLERIQRDLQRKVTALKKERARAEESHGLAPGVQALLDFTRGELSAYTDCVERISNILKED